MKRGLRGDEEVKDSCAGAGRADAVCRAQRLRRGYAAVGGNCRGLDGGNGRTGFAHKIALLYPILSDSGDGLAYYDTVYNVVMDYRLEGDSLIIGYELGTAYELIQYEYTRQSDRTV